MTITTFLRMCVLGLGIIKPILFLSFSSLLGFQSVYSHPFLMFVMLFVWVLAMWKLWDLADNV